MGPWNVTILEASGVMRYADWADTVLKIAMATST
jgi:hypothetical protein